MLLIFLISYWCFLFFVFFLNFLNLSKNICINTIIKIGFLSEYFQIPVWNGIFHFQLVSFE